MSQCRTSLSALAGVSGTSCWQCGATAEHMWGKWMRPPLLLALGASVGAAIGPGCLLCDTLSAGSLHSGHARGVLLDSRRQTQCHPLVRGGTGGYGLVGWR